MATHPDDIRYEEGPTDGEEKRKVQSVRGSTHTVSIPKPWVDRLGIEAGQYLTMKLLADGSILASPTREEPDPWVCVLEIEDPEDEDVLGAIQGAYVAGYDRIEVRHDPSQDVEAVVREAEAGLTGLTLLGGSDEGWHLECLLGNTTLDPHRGILRMFSTAHTMWTDARRGLEGDVDEEVLLQGLEEKLEDLRSMGFLVRRVCTSEVREPGLRQGLGSPVLDPLNTASAAGNCLEVGRYALAFATDAGAVRGTGSAGVVGEAHRVAQDSLQAAVLAHDRDDAEMAREAMARARRGLADGGSGPVRPDGGDGEAVAALLVEWSRQVSRLSREIATAALCRSFVGGHPRGEPVDLGG